jgi:tetratricopeptide (TPR) repeat protein
MLIVLGVLLPSLAAGHEGSEEDESRLDAALELYGAGAFVEAQGAFEQVATRHDDHPTLLFWLARAARDAGDPEVAAEAIERSLVLEPSSIDAWYLAGLVAFERGERTEARECFLNVARMDEGSLGDSARAHLDLLSWLDARDRAVRHLESGEFETARPALDRLEASRPGDPTVAYHRAYANYLAGEYGAALAGFELLATQHPEHEYGRYMAAVTLGRLGRIDEARAALEELAEVASPEVAAAALEALSRPSVAAGSSVEGRARKGSWGASAGLVHDTNPLYVSESARRQFESAASGMTVGVWGSALLAQRDAFRLSVGASGLARAYASGPGEDDFGRLRAAVELSYHLRSLTMWAGVDAGLSTLGWAPLLDLEQLYLGGRWRRPDASHAIELRGVTYRRGAHLEGYENLDGYGGRGLLQWTWRVSPVVEVGLSWSLTGEKAVPYQVEWTIPVSEAGAAGLAAVYAEGSFLEHGPRGRLLLELPWRTTELSLGADVQWRAYTVPERRTIERSGQREEDKRERRDRRWSTDLTVSTEVASPLRGYAALTLSRNESSLNADVWPIDRGFRRDLFAVGVEVRP